MLSPMDMYVATDGLPDEFHLVHLGGKALGGAGLVMTEMTCVSPEGRITPGCPGIWTDEQRDAWQRVVDFVHTRTTARIGMQLGHSGRKGSTKLMWEGMDEPLDDGNWEVIGPSPLPYGDDCHVPREATRADLDKVVADFADVRPARGRGGLRPDRGARRPRLPAQLVPLPRLQPAHRRRTAARWRTGCASRSRSSTPSAPSCPAHVPVTVRISATDWMPDGNTDEDAVEIARAFIEHGAAAIDVSSGQVEQGREAGVRPVLPDPVRRQDPPPRRRPGRARR